MYIFAEAERDEAGWAWGYEARSTNPSSAELKGKTIAANDNLTMAVVNQMIVKL